MKRYTGTLLLLLSCTGQDGVPGAIGVPGTPGAVGEPGKPGASGTAGPVGDAGSPGLAGPVGDAGSCGQLIAYTVSGEDLKAEGELASAYAFCQAADLAVGVACRSDAPGAVTFQGSGGMLDVAGHQGYWCSGTVALPGTHAVKIETRCLHVGLPDGG